MPRTKIRPASRQTEQNANVLLTQLHQQPTVLTELEQIAQKEISKHLAFVSEISTVFQAFATSVPRFC